MFGKRKRFRRVPTETVRIPAVGLRTAAAPIPDRLLKIVLGLAFVGASVYVVHFQDFFALLREGNWPPLAANAMILFLASAAFWRYLASYQRDVLASGKRFLLVAFLVLVTLLTARALTLVPSRDVPVNLAYLIPLSFPALTLTIVFGPRFGLISTGYLAVGTGLVLNYFAEWPLSLPSSPPPDWIAHKAVVVFPAPGLLPVLLVLVGGAIAACLSVGAIRNRSKLIKVGAAVGVVQAVLIVAAETMVGTHSFRSLTEFAFLLADPVWGLLSGLLLGFLVSGALPFIEHFFEVTTDLSLIELSDHNHPLLRRLLLEAPSTYHHSFLTGALAETAADSIGANSLLARVGGYFHDVGKIYKPEYFTENESHKGSHHARLSPTMSTLIIVAHTKDGVEIAKDYNIPPSIIDFIPQHHGTSVIEYFFREAQEQTAGRSEVKRDDFRYAGPKPQTKEIAIVCMADSVEAASRSLSDPTPARLENMVHRIVEAKLMDGQLDECGLTFRELRIVEETFLRVLGGIFHGRIAYPTVSPGKAAPA
jgi:putative nucleotidyltransferase with HDIG domain